MGIFSKFNKGLSRSRNKMSGAMQDMLDSFDEINDDLYSELEEILVMSDVGVYTALEIVEELRDRVAKEKIKRPDEVKDEVKEIVAEKLAGGEDLGLITKPSVLLVIGVNGVGKTTSIGKLAAKYKNEGKEVILGAADTFRAAAIDQLDIWAKRTETDIVKHKEGADPAAVVFDTINAAKNRDADIVIIDTAGRLHNKKNLMDELNKIYRVVDRELPYSDREVLLVLDATTGQNAVSQAKAFQEATDDEITGIILTKLDGTARGGVVLAIKNELKIPVKFIGVGEQVDDLQPFNPRAFAEALFEEITDELDEEESTYHDAIAANKAYYESIQHSGKVMEAQELNRVAHFYENKRDEDTPAENKKTLHESTAEPIYNAADFAGNDDAESVSDEELRAALAEVAEAFEEALAENSEEIEEITSTENISVGKAEKADTTNSDLYDELTAIAADILSDEEIEEEETEDTIHFTENTAEEIAPVIEEEAVTEAVVEEITPTEDIIQNITASEEEELDDTASLSDNLTKEIEELIEEKPVTKENIAPAVDTSFDIYDLFGTEAKTSSEDIFSNKLSEPIPEAEPKTAQPTEPVATPNTEKQENATVETKKRGGLRGLFNRHS